MSNNFDSLKEQIKESIQEHKYHQSLDAYTYNTSVLVAITATTVATLLPPTIDYIWFVKILSGIAALLIALDRSLNWGARWLYHRTMRHEYLIIEAKISFYENITQDLSSEEKHKYYLEIYNDLYTLRRREAYVPGVKEIELPSIQKDKK
ncbi:hypothetical protein [Xanthocytophaga flava]|uniref:hypothetical protein n=1 Tax=Xanthocytophaga flava TaxID=3048013 RepID=UPI0028D19D53|nr:hypothetical protein [Xanthocytophaga flavus]MDJ1473544.1 hypothetical protein [Xanthocytophaga flavus]